MTLPCRTPRGFTFCSCFFLLLASCWAVPAEAAQKIHPKQGPPPETSSTSEKVQPAPLIYSTPHSNVFGLSVAYQAPLSLEKSPPLGGGITYTREYFVSRRTALGVHVGLRLFPVEPLHLALGYGLTFKHYITPLKPSGPTTGLYLLYGLLLQMNFVKGREGSATDHDTRLAIGYDWQAGPVIPTLEVGYHLTQLRNFDEDTVWWPYTELVGGIRF